MKYFCKPSCDVQTKHKKEHQTRACAKQSREAWFPTKARDHQPLVVLLYKTGENKSIKSINVAMVKLHGLN